jgi:hypothetical protein
MLCFVVDQAIVSPINSQVFYCCGWMLREYSAAQTSAGKLYAASDMSPVWKQDNTTMECEVCIKKFNFFFRRHHCRSW